MSKDKLLAQIILQFSPDIQEAKKPLTDLEKAAIIVRETRKVYETK